MESYSKMTETELLHQIEDCKKWHEAIKKEAIQYTLQIEELEKQYNNKLIDLENIEKKYVDLMKELTDRE